MQDDPQLPLHCPECGASLCYLTSTRGRDETRGQGAPVHHYRCTNYACWIGWKLGVDGPLKREAASRGGTVST
jgi:hypothetical protein